MTFEKAVNEVKDRLETVGERGQGVAKVSFKALKAANEVVIEGVQDLVSTQTAAAKDLYTAGKQSFDKAVAAGLVAVVKSPIEYLPDGRDTIVDAFNDTVATVTKTGEKLVKVVKHGYEGVAATIQGKSLRTQTGKKVARKTRKVSADISQTVAA
jgi:uncharacterized phage infection (PIP) family protein YhgE